jgi:hypothetical protein
MAKPLKVIEEPATHLVDKVLEARLAELIGTTARALENKRQSGVIPQGVWEKINGRIMYSLERYNEWAEKQWVCRQASRSEAKPSASASRTKASVGASRLPIARPRRGSQRQVISVLV